MINKWIAYLVLDNERQKVIFECEGNPVEYLWTRYGMDTYIESVDLEINTIIKEEKNNGSSI